VKSGMPVVVVELKVVVLVVMVIGTGIVIGLRRIQLDARYSVVWYVVLVVVLRRGVGGGRCADRSNGYGLRKGRR
jgi:hypothetical protein